MININLFFKYLVKILRKEGFMINKAKFKELSLERTVTIEIKNDAPIDLVTFSNCMLGFASEYKHFLEKNKQLQYAEDPKLYINKIENGSVIATLSALMPVAMPLLDGVNTVYNFTQNFISLFDYLKTGEGDKPTDIDMARLNHAQGFIKPVVNDQKALINININSNNNNTVNNSVNYTIDHADSIKMSRNISKEKSLLKEDATQREIYEKRVLQWDKATNTHKNNRSDRVIIESIDPAPARVMFVDEKHRIVMLQNRQNPFMSFYIVDVEVQRIDGRPVLYTIIDIIETVSSEQSDINY